MSFFSRLFGKKSNKDKTGGMEDYMTLVRVYFQASLASNLGINIKHLIILQYLLIFQHQHYVFREEVAG